MTTMKKKMGTPSVIMDMSASNNLEQRDAQADTGNTWRVRRRMRTDRPLGHGQQNGTHCLGPVGAWENISRAGDRMS